MKSRTYWLNEKSSTFCIQSNQFLYRKLQYAFHDFYLSVKHTGYYIKAFVLSDRYVINLFTESRIRHYLFHDRFGISRYLVLNIACTTCLISCKHECASSHVIEWYFMQMILRYCFWSKYYKMRSIFHVSIQK